MLLLKRQDLVVGLLRDALALVGRVVELLDMLDGGGDLTLVALVHAVLVTLLLAPDINLLAEGLVIRLEVIELNEGLVELVLEQLDLVLVLSHLSGGWASAESSSAFSELILSLFVLVFENHQAPK